MSDILDSLVAKSGLGGRSGSVGPKIPSVKLDGSVNGDTAGEFVTFDGEKFKSLGSNLSIQIIRVRKKLLASNDTMKFFSDEYDSSTHDVVRLQKQNFNSTTNKWGDPEVVAKSTPAKLREMFEVKVASVVYCVLNGELTKLNVKGASTTGDDGLYSYLESFNDGKHAFQFMTDITTSKIVKNRAVSYFRMHFKRGAEITDVDVFHKTEGYLDIIENSARSKRDFISTAVESTPQVTEEEEFGF
jgi:hypothetical protein